MTPKKKAVQLIAKFRPLAHKNFTMKEDGELTKTKKIALHCVNEILLMLDTLHKPEYVCFVAKKIYSIPQTEYTTHIHGYEMVDYWKQVKKEIKKI